MANRQKAKRLILGEDSIHIMACYLLFRNRSVMFAALYTLSSTQKQTQNGLKAGPKFIS
jgi:hypothetical protein